MTLGQGHFLAMNPPLELHVLYQFHYVYNSSNAKKIIVTEIISLYAINM